MQFIINSISFGIKTHFPFIIQINSFYGAINEYFSLQNTDIRNNQFVIVLRNHWLNAFYANLLTDGEWVGDWVEAESWLSRDWAQLNSI